VKYPQHLHEAHIDLSFCPTREKPLGKRDDKLLAALCDKHRYIIHYRNSVLQQCTHHGLRRAKVHRARMQFAQSSWLCDYIEFNTKFRILAKNDFEKNLYKLMNNMVFGKTMENVRDRARKIINKIRKQIRCEGNDLETKFPYLKRFLGESGHDKTA